VNAAAGLVSEDFSWCADYSARLQMVLRSTDWRSVGQLADALRQCWQHGRQVFLCGNGGSAANAVHLANDLLYGVAPSFGGGLRVHALPANMAVLTCLANDVGYDEVFSLQLAVQAHADDVLIVLSGSGNSPNIIKAIEAARKIGMRSFAVLGYSGGEAKALVDVPIHFAIDDMQISEDLQLIVGHMVMQRLCKQKPAQARG
jgi:D-sedoheptulose 7-phosphate isomerase